MFIDNSNRGIIMKAAFNTKLCNYVLVLKNGGIQLYAAMY